MAYLNEEQLNKLGFKKIGKNVKISDKASIYNPELIEIGDFSRVDDFCVLSGKITMGRNVHIAPHCLVAGGEPGVELDDFSGLAYFVQVFSQSDDYSGETMTNPTVPSIYRKEIKKKTSIGKHSIVGAGSVVLPGVRLSEGTSVGAKSLVRKSTEEWSIYLGNPAKRLKARSRNLIELEKKFLEEERNDTI
ncbi:acyltransferase [Vibrio sp. Vb2880]|uniref:acyltransferase n=1 Tax=Vibrio TaxID=662 RepID=UPI001F40DB4A|nr:MULTISPECIES: acyltransferase [Vibrio]MCF7454668.1 acyltransferase [Vibrio sp. A1-1]MCG6238385.1 acyltransferase [Vibrio diabolicus]MCG9622784.1 acyltransferase [Vibrio diabolicus]MCR9533389.1 acyltransferase [Vibrio alginolyticus]MDW1575880.1 acyltransferase [Vibrio sp. Vb2880]